MTDEQRRALAVSLGLPEDSPEADLHAAARERAEANPPGETTPPGDDGEPEGASDDDAGDGAVEQPEAALASGQAVLVDRARLDELEQNAALGAQARQEQVAARRDSLVQAALDDGRISPASRQEWRDDLDKAPEATERALARLSKGAETPGNARASGRTNSDGADGPDRVIASVRGRRGDHEHGKVTHR